MLTAARPISLDTLRHKYSYAKNHCEVLLRDSLGGTAKRGGGGGGGCLH